MLRPEAAEAAFCAGSRAAIGDDESSSPAKSELGCGRGPIRSVLRDYAAQLGMTQLRSTRAGFGLRLRQPSRETCCRRAARRECHALLLYRQIPIRVGCRSRGFSAIIDYVAPRFVVEIVRDWQLACPGQHADGKAASVAFVDYADSQSRQFCPRGSCRS